MSATVGRRRVAGLLMLQLSVAVLEAAGLVLLVPVIQALGGGTRFSVPGTSLRLSLTGAFGLVVVVVVLRALGQWRAAVSAVDIRLATIDRLRLDLIDDLYTSDWTYLSAQRRSHVVASLTTDVERAQSAIAMVIRLVIGTLILIATAAVAVVVAPVVGGLAALAVLVVVLLASRSTRGASALGRATTVRMAGFGAALSDSLSSVRVMRAHGASQAWSDLVRGEAGRVRDVRRRFVARSASISAVLGVVAVLTVLGLILIGREVGLSLAEMATLIVIATRLLTSAQALLGSAQLFASEVAVLEQLLDLHAEIRLHPEARPASQESAASEALTGAPTGAPGLGPAGTRGGAALLELRRVSVGYAEDEPVLRDVDLAVPYRGLVTLVGASGSGKSTLLDVVLGLLRPETGTMLVDGAPVADLAALAAWRRRIGYVPQQTVLVPGTVWQNLAWSLQPGVALTEESAWSALRTACLDDVVAALPGGIEASLHELTELSGGEQQRLSIARALVRDPELLILDEATGALDRRTEARLLANLLDTSRAVLVVTHRTPADHPGTVLRLEGGRAVRHEDPRTTKSLSDS